MQNIKLLPLLLTYTLTACGTEAALHEPTEFNEPVEQVQHAAHGISHTFYKTPTYGRLFETPTPPDNAPSLILTHALPMTLPDPTHVYAPSTENVDDDDVYQTYNGDCWLNAVFAALAYRHPLAIKDAIHDTEDKNLWQVRLFALDTRKPVYVYVRREYFIYEPLADRVVNDIKWPAILQNAIVQYNDATGHINPNVRGYRALSTNFPSTAYKILLDGGSWMEQMSKFDDNSLRNRVYTGYPLVVVSLNAPPNRIVVPHHAYTVLDVDWSRGGGITLRNPWGTGGYDGQGTEYLDAKDIRANFGGLYFSWPP